MKISVVEFHLRLQLKTWKRIEDIPLSDHFYEKLQENLFKGFRSHKQTIDESQI